ncbi:MAG: PEP-CTERM sorting domain-containing protein [Verrucomicrobiaceae bacterium]
MKTSRLRGLSRSLILPAALASSAGTAQAYLGGFEQEDGYRDFLGRVETYNAGQYGANVNPSATSTNIPTNSGAWQKIVGTSGVYATGHFGRDRLNPGSAHNGGYQALVITTNGDGWAGTGQTYDYDLDALDLGGADPLNTSSSKVNLSFWSCPTDIYGADQMPSGYFGDSVAFRDSSGNVGVSVGYHIANDTGSYGNVTLAYNLNGTWVDTGIDAANSYYQQWDVTLDLANQTVNVDLVDGGYTKTPISTGVPQYVGTGNRTTFINNQALTTNMSNLTSLQFHSSPGASNSKQWQVDDFKGSIVAVPEPSSTLLVLLSSIVLTARRRRT